MSNFFTHPMRPFFTASALLGIVAASGFFFSAQAVVLHRQIFLGFVLPAAYGGFLTAAMLEWTGYRGRLKPVAYLLGALLSAGFVLLFVSPAAAAYCTAAYWLALWLFCAYLLWLDRNTDNFALLLLLGAFAAFQTAYARTGGLHLLKAQVHIHMAAVAFVSFRVSILLGNEALKDCRLKDPIFIPNAVYKNIAVIFLLLCAAAELWLPVQTAGFAALGAGCILLAKLRELHHRELLRKHYVRTYYWLQLFGAAGYLWLGVAKLNNQSAATPLHLITLAALLGGILMVWLTAGLWHSGFTKLDYPRLCRFALPCFFTAALVRTAGLWLSPALFSTAVPAVLVAAGFALYLAAFVPIFRENAFTDDPE